MNIKSLFGFRSKTDKIAEYRRLLKERELVSKEVDGLAETFMLQKSQMEDLIKSNDPDLTEKGRKCFQQFLIQQPKDIINVYKKKSNLEKSISNLEKDEEIKDVLKDIKSFYDIRSLWKKRLIKKSIYFNLLKAKQGKIRFADVLLFNGKGELLILQRAKDDGSYSEDWCIPGGHVDPGEDFRTAAKRELYEETGIDLSEESLTEVAVFDDNKVEIHYFMGYLSLDSSNLILVDGFEEIGSAWIEINKINEYSFIFDMKENIERILGLTSNSIKVEQKLAVLFKAYQNEEISADVLKSFCEKNADKLRKAKNKTYFSHKERKDLAEKGEAMPNGKYPIRNSQDLKDAIRLVGASDMPESEVKSWIKKRAKALGLENELPESWKEVEKSELEDIDDNCINKTLIEEFEKSQFLPIGTVKNYNGKEYEKTNDGWKPKKRGPKTVSKEDLDKARELGKKAKVETPYQDEEYQRFEKELGKLSDTQKIKLLHAYIEGRESVEKAEGIEEAQILSRESLDSKTKGPQGSGIGDNIEKARKPTKILTIECCDNEDSLEKIINTIKSLGNVGHSFTVLIDPDYSQKDGGSVRIGWDGDGSDYIGDIKVRKIENIEKSIDFEDQKGFSLKIQFNDLEEAQMFKSLVEDWNNEGKINIQSIEESLEKSSAEEKNVFNSYLNFIEGAKTRLKNIHWGEEDNSKHVYLDDLSNEVSEFEDKIAEAGQSGFGRFKDGEIQGDEIDENDPIKICQMIFDRTIEFRKELENKDTYDGEISWIDDFLANLKQSKYRLQMH